MRYCLQQECQIISLRSGIRHVRYLANEQRNCGDIALITPTEKLNENTARESQLVLTGQVNQQNK